MSCTAPAGSRPRTAVCSWPSVSGPRTSQRLGAPGINPFGLLLHTRSFTPSAQAIEYVGNQKKVLEEKGPEGFRVIEDLENWVDGVNGYEASLPAAERTLKPLTFADAIAGFAFIGSIFGNGGGQEVLDSEYKAQLENNFGESAGKEIFKDLRGSTTPKRRRPAKPHSRTTGNRPARRRAR